jgi:tripartite ATP-independent transporter DctP family solute receptor
MRRIVTALAASLVILCWTASEAAEITIKAAHSNAAGEVQDEGLKYFKRRLEEMTKGRATIDIYPNMQLGNELQAIEGLLLGTVDMTVPSNAAFSNFVTEFRAFDMPFLFRDMEHMDRVVSGPVFEELRAAAAKKGIRLLGIYSSGIRHIMTKEPIKSMADLKGKKIRTMQNPVHIEAFKAFGANATPLAYGELYGALQTGVVDGAEAANTNYNGMRFYEVAKNWALIGWLNLTAPLVISERKYATLPADVQQALTEAGAESAKWERKLVTDTDKPLLERIKAQGATITVPDPEPFRQASRQVYEKMLSAPNDKKLLGLILEIQ